MKPYDKIKKMDGKGTYNKISILAAEFLAHDRSEWWRKKSEMYALYINRYYAVKT